jgi:hypothetical protein
MKRAFILALSFPLFGVLLASASEPALSLAKPEIGSYLYEPSYQWDCKLRGNPVAYVPQPGDVMLATDPNIFWMVTHDLAFAYEPHNSAIIFERSCGGLAMLEAGPNDTLWVRNLDMLPHLKEYQDKGPVWIRKRKTPLNADQSGALTAFAERQNGKRFALGRLGLQLTPIRARGPIRTEWLGKPRGDRRAYYCSELVLESLVAAGLLNPDTTRPGATYPHDLFFDHSHNRYIAKHLPLACDWHPPARWVPCPAEGSVTAPIFTPLVVPDPTKKMPTP